jgi:hypothetical protein
LCNRFVEGLRRYFKGELVAFHVLAGNRAALQSHPVMFAFYSSIYKEKIGGRMVLYPMLGHSHEAVMTVIPHPEKGR